MAPMYTSLQSCISHGACIEGYDILVDSLLEHFGRPSIRSVREKWRCDNPEFEADAHSTYQLYGAELDVNMLIPMPFVLKSNGRDDVAWALRTVDSSDPDVPRAMRLYIARHLARHPLLRFSDLAKSTLRVAKHMIQGTATGSEVNNIRGHCAFGNGLLNPNVEATSRDESHLWTLTRLAILQPHAVPRMLWVHSGTVLNNDNDLKQMLNLYHGNLEQYANDL